MKFKKELVKLANKLYSYGLNDESEKIRSIFKVSKIELGDIILDNDWNNYIAKTKTNPEAARMVAYAWNLEEINPVDDIDFKAFVKWYVDYKTKMGKKRGEHLHSHEIIKALIDTPAKMKLLNEALNLYVENLVKTKNPNARGNEISSRVKKIMGRYTESFSALEEYAESKEESELEEAKEKQEREALKNKKEFESLQSESKIQFAGRFDNVRAFNKGYSGTWKISNNKLVLAYRYGGNMGPAPGSRTEIELKKQILVQEMNRFMSKQQAYKGLSGFGAFSQNINELAKIDPTAKNILNIYNSL